MRLGLPWLALLVLACNAEGENPPAETTSLQESPALQRIARGRTVQALDVDGERVLVGLREPILAESDQSPVYELVRYDRGGVVRLFPQVRQAAFAGDSVLVITKDDELARLTAGGSQLLTDRVHGKPASLDDGSWIVSRHGDEPGESDLWQVLPSGSLRQLTTARGPDELPIAVPGGKLLFVSGRTSLASLWSLDVGTGEAQQLTNRGLTAGADLASRVPTPVRVLAVTARSLTYDAGDGARWRVDLETGRSTRP